MIPSGTMTSIVLPDVKCSPAPSLTRRFPFLPSNSVLLPSRCDLIFVACCCVMPVEMILDVFHYLLLDGSVVVTSSDASLLTLIRTGVTASSRSSRGPARSVLPLLLGPALPVRSAPRVPATTPAQVPAPLLRRCPAGVHRTVCGGAHATALHGSGRRQLDRRTALLPS